MQTKQLDLLEIGKTPALVNNETVFLSCNVTKYNDLGFRQERVARVDNLRSTRNHLSSE